MENDTRRCIDCQSGGARYTVVRLYKFHTHLSKINLAALFHHSVLCLFHQFRFLQLMFNKPHGKPCGIDRYIDLRQDIRQCADVVFMAVGDHKPFHLLFVFN